MKAHRPVTLLGYVALLATLFMVSCVDGPVAGPTTEGSPSTLVFAPQLSYAVASGAPALSAAQEGALNEAFDLVNRFRLIVTRLGTDEVLLDEIIEVTPGQDVYDLSVEVPGITPGEPVSVVIIAMQGETTLFESPPLTVATTDTQTATPPQPFSVPLTYTGPGAEAVSVEILSSGAVLAPGGTRTLEAVVTGSDGVAMPDVPLGWTSAAPSVASVNAGGTVAGGGGGRTQVTVTTPTGLSTSVWVYVFGGEMTFIQGGMVMTAPVVGGTAQAIAGTGGAHGPVPTGNGVMYSEGGMVHISGVPIMEGSWPAPSPDGTKIAVSGVTLANADGSGATAGPTGSQPAWASATSLYVSGGSIELVDVVTGSRSLVVSGAASFPTVTAEGRLAYLDGAGQVFIQGSGPVPGVVTGSRPAISGGWVLYAGGSGLMVAPTDGGSPPMALGMSGTDPAWGAASGGFTPPTPPPAVEITGLDPEVPVPGQEAVILGSGFDPIIAANTTVFFPTDGGEIEVEVLEITETSIRVMVPRGVAAGVIRVATLSSEATFPYTPMFGSVAVMAVTPWGAPVAGVGVTLTGAGVETPSGTTDGDGSLFLDGILAGDYTAAYTAPDGFSLTGTPPTALTVTTDVLSVEVEATPEVRAITISPEVPEVEVGSSVEVMLQPLDINGDVIPQIDQVTWASSSPQLNASGSTLTGTLTGVSPSATSGDALFRVFINGTGADFFATVTSYIDGTFTLGAAAPAPGEADKAPQAAPEPIRPIEVELSQGSTVLERTESDTDGHYRFRGLMAGAFTVKPLPRGDYKGFSPSSENVTLGGGNATGRADFEVLKEAAELEEGSSSDFRALILSNTSYSNGGAVSVLGSAMPDVTFEQFTGTPTLAYLTTFNVVLLFEDGVFSTSHNVGDAVAAYVAAGGNVVLGTFYWQDRSDSSWGTGTLGWGNLEAIDPFTTCRIGPCAPNGGSEYNADALDPASIVPHTLTAGVNSLSVDSYHGGVTAKPGTTVLALWSDGVPLIGYRTEAGGQRLVGLSVAPWYFNNLASAPGDFVQLWDNALRFAAAGTVPTPAPAPAKLLAPSTMPGLVSPVEKSGRPSGSDGGGGRRR